MYIKKNIFMNICIYFANNSTMENKNKSGNPKTSVAHISAFNQYPSSPSA